MNKKKTIATLVLATLLPCVASAQSFHAVKYVTKYGDSMGYFSDETASKRTETLYGKNNRIERKIQTALTYSDNEVAPNQWVLEDYYRYEYDQNNNLTQTNSWEYGLYDENNWKFRVSSDTITYKYNDANQLIEKFDQSRNEFHAYEYDADGNVVKDIRTKYYSTKKEYVQDMTIVYSDFTLGGPQAATATATSSYNNYTGKMTYDANGKKTSELHWATDGTLNYAEYWTYDETGMLTLYEKKGISGGKEIDSQKTVYEKIDDNNIQQISYTYSSAKGWSISGGSKAVTTYADFDGEKYAPTLTSVVADDNKSTMTVTFNAPEIDGATFNIYRDGLLVANTTDKTYTDTDVPNGDHEYFIQTVVNGVGKNCSNVIKQHIYRELPCATNFRALKATKDTDGNYNVTLAWTNPTITDDMGFKNTNIYKISTYYDVPMLDTYELITDPTQNTIDLNFGIDAVLTLYVQTRYIAGTVHSDTIVVDATKLVSKVVNNNNKLRVIETYGDAMGESAGITKKAITYYGTNNRIEREAKYSNTVSEDATTQDWTIYEYTSYIYNDVTGAIEKSYTNQYGRYDYGDMGFKAAQDTTYYETNVEGQTTKEYNSLGYTTYEYAANGSVSKKYIVEFGTSNVEQTIEYSDFAGKDMPQTTVSTGTRSSACYTLSTTYNVDGKKSTEKKTMDHPTSSNPSTYETWTYDVYGELSIDSVYTIKTVNDVETLVEKSFTTYVPEEDNNNRIVVTKKVYDNILGKYTNPKTYNIYEYTDIDADKYQPELDVTPVDDMPNTVALSVVIPSSLQNGKAALNIYRNGIEIAHGINFFDDEHFSTDEYGYNGVFTYQDEAVANGRYDYYVEYAKLDNSLENEVSIHNISNIVSYTYDLPLPRVTGLEMTDARYTTTLNSTDEGTVQEFNGYATLNWVAPEDAEEYGVKQYRVMVVGMSIGENDDTEDPLATSYELDLRGREDVTVYIQAVYPYGRSSSDSIQVTEQMIKDFVANGISNIDNDQNSNLSPLTSNLYNIAGQQVGNEAKGIIIKNRKKIIVK